MSRCSLLANDHSGTAPAVTTSCPRVRLELRDAIDKPVGARDAADAEPGKAERRVNERRLPVDSDTHAKPHEIHTEQIRHWADQRQDDARQPDEVEEERKDEDQDVD